MEVGREERCGLLGGSVGVEHLPYQSDGRALQRRRSERRREPQALDDLGDTRVIDGAGGVALTLAEAAAEERIHRLLRGRLEQHEERTGLGAGERHVLRRGETNGRAVRP